MTKVILIVQEKIEDVKNIGLVKTLYRVIIIRKNGKGF